MGRPPAGRRRQARGKRTAPQLPLWGKDTLLIESVSQEGRGVARRDGKVVFVSGALPGEQVLVQCTLVKRSYDEADMLQLVEGTTPSSGRVEPPCPLYGACGGCSLQHWSPVAQLEHQQAMLLAMLQQLAPDLVLDPPLASPAQGFRHRLRLKVLRNPDRSYSLGMRERSSNQVVPVTTCLVANAAVNAMLLDLPERLAAVPELQGLREIDIDCDSGDRIGLCCYFAAKPGHQAVAALRDAVMSAPIVALRVRTPGPKNAPADDLPGQADPDALVGWEELYAEGELLLELPCAWPAEQPSRQSVTLAYLPGDFTQTHWQVNATLVGRVLDHLQPAADEQALDLFSGIGNFSLPLARHVKSVHALEGDSAMSARIGRNAQRNAIDNISAATANLMSGDLALPRADIAIIDPPRAGAQAVCEILARSGVRRLAYISCHPATLLRDARVLAKAGYSITRAAAVDMFPHTGHSEALVLFERKSRR